MTDRNPIDLPIAALKEMYLDRGLSTYRIGELIGRNNTYVGRRLAAAGVKMRSSRRPDLSDDDIKRLYVVEGLSLAQAAAHLGVSDKTVLDRLEKMGIQRRPGGRRKKLR